MGRYRSREKRWVHPVYLFACCYPRNGVVYTEINFNGRTIRETTRLKWIPRSRDIAMKILEQRAQAVLFPDETASTHINSVNKLFKYFWDNHVQNQGRSQKNNYLQSFGKLIKSDLPLSNKPEHMRNIREHIIKNISLDDNKHLSPYTMYKHVQRMKTMFTFAIDEEIIDRNPIKKSILPKYNLEQSYIPTPEDIYDLLGQICQTHPRTAEIIKFAALTAMRINEIINIRPKDIDGNRLIIRGKAGRNRGFPLTPYIGHYFYIAPYTGINEYIYQLRQYTANDRLFGYTSYAILERRIKEARQYIGIKEDFNFHAIRKMRENQWLNDYKFERHFVARLCGHSKDVQGRHYMKELEADELSEYLSREFK